MSKLLASGLALLERRFAESNAFSLKELSKQAVQQAVIEYDKTLAMVSLIAYSLGKILSKKHIVSSKRWKKERRHILALLESARQLLKENKMQELERQLEQIGKSIFFLDKSLGYFERNVFEKAKIKNASTAYALGLSLTQAAELMGANKKDLLEYIASTKMHDEEGITKGIVQRLKELREELGL